MNRIDLFRAMEMIDERILEQSEQNSAVKYRRKIPRKTIILAAALCLLTVAATATFAAKWFSMSDAVTPSYVFKTAELYPKYGSAVLACRKRLFCPIRDISIRHNFVVPPPSMSEANPNTIQLVNRGTFAKFAARRTSTNKKLTIILRGGKNRRHRLNY